MNADSPLRVHGAQYVLHIERIPTDAIPDRHVLLLALSEHTEGIVRRFMGYRGVNYLGWKECVSRGHALVLAEQIGAHLAESTGAYVWVSWGTVREWMRAHRKEDT